MIFWFFCICFDFFVFQEENIQPQFPGGVGDAGRTEAKAISEPSASPKRKGVNSAKRVQPSLPGLELEGGPLPFPTILQSRDLTAGPHSNPGRGSWRRGCTSALLVRKLRLRAVR